MIGKTNIGSGSSLSFKGALLCITAPTGSTITLIKNNLIIKILYPKDQHILFNDNTSANWYYSVSPSNYGEWTVMITLGVDSTSVTVTISDNKQYDLAIYPPVYLVKNGTKIADITGQNHTVITQQSEYVNFYINGNYVATFTSTDPVDLTRYNQINITIPNNDGRSYYRSGVVPSLVIGSSRPVFNDQSSSASYSNFSRVEMLSSSTTISANTYTMDISSFSGTYYVGIAICGSSSITASLNVSELVVTQ